MIAVVAKLGAERDLGMYSFGLALSQPVIFLSQLNLSNILAVDVKGSHPLAAFFSLRLTLRTGRYPGSNYSCRGSDHDGIGSD